MRGVRGVRHTEALVAHLRYKPPEDLPVRACLRQNYVRYLRESSLVFDKQYDGEMPHSLPIYAQ